MPVRGSDLISPPPSKDQGNIRLIFNPHQLIPDWDQIDPDTCITKGGTTVIATNLTEEQLAAFIFWMNVPFQCVATTNGVTWPFTSPSLKTMQELYMQFLGAFLKGG
jgi:hypothetical protein